MLIFSSVIIALGKAFTFKCVVNLDSLHLLRDLRMQWSRAYTLVCEVALSNVEDSLLWHNKYYFLLIFCHVSCSHSLRPTCVLCGNYILAHIKMNREPSTKCGVTLLSQIFGTCSLHMYIHTWKLCIRFFGGIAHNLIRFSLCNHVIYKFLVEIAVCIIPTSWVHLCLLPKRTNLMMNPFL